MTQARIQQLQRHRLQRPGGCRDQGTERPTSLSDELITAVTAAAVGSDAICRDLARRLTQSYRVSVARSTTDRSPPGTNWCCHHYPSARHQSWMRTGRRTSTCTTRSISWHRSMCRRSTLPSCLIETSRQSYTARGAEPSGSCSPSTCVGSDLTRHCARWSRNAPGRATAGEDPAGGQDASLTVGPGGWSRTAERAIRAEARRGRYGVWLQTRSFIERPRQHVE